jgi:hypothetical protein
MARCGASFRSQLSNRGVSPDVTANVDTHGFASAAGPLGPGYPSTAGHSTAGQLTPTMLSRASGGPGEIDSTTLGLASVTAPVT